MIETTAAGGRLYKDSRLRPQHDDAFIDTSIPFYS